MKRVERYKTANRKVPFQGWLDKLRKEVQGCVIAHINRVAAGGVKKNLRSVGFGVHEIKISWGPGLRVYFGNRTNVMILLLLGGDKNSQNRDIKKAQRYWRSYNESN